MSRNIYEPPSPSKTAFSCPYCLTKTTQYWFQLFAVERDRSGLYTAETWQMAIEEEEAAGRLDDKTRALFERWILEAKNRRLRILDGSAGENQAYGYEVEALRLSRCMECHEITIWLDQKMVWPDQQIDHRAHEMMPPTAREEFDEAAKVFRDSPRAGCALLRTCLEKICADRGHIKGTLFARAGSLVSEMSSLHGRQAVDIVRVFGNESIHPGKMEANDIAENAERMFDAINLIVEEVYDRPARFSQLFEKLSPSQRREIERRDS